MLKNWLYQNNIWHLKQRKKFLSLFFSCFFFLNFAQVNQVGNPSFETFYTSCGGSNLVSKLKYWNGLDSTYVFGAGFCYNTCYLNVPNTGQGFQNPKSGNGFIRLQAYCTNPCSFYSSRSYPKNRLLTNLVSGTTYCVKMFVNLQNTSVEAINALQILLSDISIDSTKYGNTPQTFLNPQITNTLGIINDTLNWIEVKGTFTSNGTEKYLIIGDFKTDAVTSASAVPTGAGGGGNWSEYMIDDVSVIDFNLVAYAGPDKNINLGDSAFIGRPPEIGLECTWSSGTVSVGSGGGIWVKPPTVGTFSYVVTQNICGLIKKDTVNVNVAPGFVSENEMFSQSISVYPQPAKDLVNITFVYFYEKSIEIKIMDINGREIETKELEVVQGKTQLSTSELANGVYILQITNNNHQSVSKRLVIAK